MEVDPEMQRDVHGLEDEDRDADEDVDARGLLTVGGG